MKASKSCRGQDARDEAQARAALLSGPVGSLVAYRVVAPLVRRASPDTCFAVRGPCVRRRAVMALRTSRGEGLRGKGMPELLGNRSRWQNATETMLPAQPLPLDSAADLM